jgi:hypothetical protein
MNESKPISIATLRDKQEADALLHYLNTEFSMLRDYPLEMVIQPEHYEGKLLIPQLYRLEIPAKNAHLRDYSTSLEKVRNGVHDFCSGYAACKKLLDAEIEARLKKEAEEKEKQDIANLKKKLTRLKQRLNLQGCSREQNDYLKELNFDELKRMYPFCNAQQLEERANHIAEEIYKDGGMSWRI